MSNLISRNDKQVSVGDKVYILEVPVRSQHRFVVGTVTALTEKQVVIEAIMDSRWGDTEKRTVRRYPEQVIVID